MYTFQEASIGVGFHVVFQMTISLSCPSPECLHYPSFSFPPTFIFIFYFPLCLSITLFYFSFLRRSLPPTWKLKKLTWICKKKHTVCVFPHPWLFLSWQLHWVCLLSTGYSENPSVWASTTPTAQIRDTHMSGDLILCFSTMEVNLECTSVDTDNFNLHEECCMQLFLYKQFLLAGIK